MRGSADSVDLDAAVQATNIIARRLASNELCGGRRGVTAETAFLLAKVLGTTPEFWLNLQFMNDMWLAQHNEVLAEKLGHARPLVAA